MIYGSHAKGTEKPESDIDIAVFMGKGYLDYNGKSLMTLDLMKLLNRDIDIVSFSDVSCVLQMQIIKNGELISCRDRKMFNQFKLRAIQEYLDLKTIRKPIEDELKNVSIYG